MTALQDALASAQRSVLAALAKRHMAAGEPIAADELVGTLDAIGCTDAVEQVQLLAAWNVLRANGSQPPDATPTPDSYAARREMEGTKWTVPVASGSSPRTDD